jgi:hypothetical protein
MRLAIDSVVAVLLAGVLGLLLLDNRAAASRLERAGAVHLALAHLSEQARLHGSMAGAGGAVFPAFISPAWFAGDLPVNVLAPRQPWLDVAPAGDGADHPPDPVLVDPGQAGFWYNPGRGVVRARVPARGGPAEARELYNQVNDSALKVLAAGDGAGRKPVPWREAAAVGVSKK